MQINSLRTNPLLKVAPIGLAIPILGEILSLPQAQGAVITATGIHIARTG